jgi:O-acetylhomoserine/O-acetylserine sulfhydrylase-like pyridoxal-dependent enzyme
MTKDRFKSGRYAHSVPPGTAGLLAHNKAKSSTPLPPLSLATLLSHAGVVSSESNAPMSPPLCLASTYTRPPDGPYHDDDYHYTRTDNPTRTLLEDTVGRLECHGDERDFQHVISCAFASGMAAVSSILLSHKSPVTVLLPSDSYHGVPTVLADHLSRFEITYETVDSTDASNLEKALSTQVGKDVVVWLETPSNPLCQVIDIEATCAIVNEFRPHANITTVVDSTLAPPCVTQPLRVSEKLIILHSFCFRQKTYSNFFIVGCRYGYAFCHKVSWRPFGRATRNSNSITLDHARSSAGIYPTSSAD